MKSSQDWQAIRSLLPYVWQYKTRVILALVLLCLAKVANVSVPLVLKGAVDALDPQLPMACCGLPALYLMNYAMRYLPKLFIAQFGISLEIFFHIYIVFPYVFICSAKPVAFHEILNVAVGVSLFY
jgi:ABC-type multidrug transport system fused ATPase/permease subunit